MFLEEERLASGAIARTGVVLLTNKECPWRCLMCDLWKNTTTHPVAPGAIPRQIEQAKRIWAEGGALPQQVKLYNSGSFFDPAAIPPEDDATIAGQLAFAENVVVESHPLLIGERALRLRDRLDGTLEVAVGLETAHPGVLARLNKKFDLPRFARAAEFLRSAGIALRVFLLVHPPFLREAEGPRWTVKSAECAFACGATAVSLIPTRGGNGAMERLRESGAFVPPTLRALEESQGAVLALRRGRVFTDLWGLEAFSTCASCFEARRRRLDRINRTQVDEPPVACEDCGGT